MIEGHFQAIFVYKLQIFFVLRRLLETPLVIFGVGGHGPHDPPWSRQWAVIVTGPTKYLSPS